MAGRPTLEAPYRVGLMPKCVRREPLPWKTADLIQKPFTLPLTRLSSPRAPYLYSNREHLIMTTTPIGRADVMIVLLALALYAATGIAVATTFLVFGVTRVLAKPVPVTFFKRKETMEIKDVVKEKYGQAVLRVQSGESSCCDPGPRLMAATR